jgi:hypothetical protein
MLSHGLGCLNRCIMRGLLAFVSSLALLLAVALAAPAARGGSTRQWALIHWLLNVSAGGVRDAGVTGELLALDSQTDVDPIIRPGRPQFRTRRGSPASSSWCSWLVDALPELLPPWRTGLPVLIRRRTLLAACGPPGRGRSLWLGLDRRPTGPSLGPGLGGGTFRHCSLRASSLHGRHSISIHGGRHGSTPDTVPIRDRIRTRRGLTRKKPPP